MFLLYIPESPQQQPDTSTDSSSADKWKSRVFMIGVLIWISILSVVIIVSIVLLIICSCRYRSAKDYAKKKRNEQRYGIDLSDHTTDELTNTTDPQSDAWATSTSDITGRDTVRSFSDFGELSEDVKGLKEETFKDYDNETLEKYATVKLKY